MSHKIELKEEVYDILTKHCVETYKKNEMIPADILLNELMSYPEIPIHYPYHHFIMPAVLLTLSRQLKTTLPKKIYLQCLTVQNRVPKMFSVVFVVFMAPVVLR